MNEEWLVDSELENQDEFVTSVGVAEHHKDKHQNVDVPIPAWPLYFIMPLAIIYAHIRKRR